MGEMDGEEQARIKLETRQDRIECLVCSPDAADDCRDLARAFADHFSDPRALAGSEALLRKVNRVDEWIVCDHCQTGLSREDKLRLMSIWVAIEGLRNWLRTEVHLGLKGILPVAPPVQLA